MTIELLQHIRREIEQYIYKSKPFNKDDNFSKTNFAKDLENKIYNRSSNNQNIQGVLKWAW